ncbi:MAG: cyclohexa-1,5-dienecarbonyl-CoA hydratase [Gammaproteobacteria bacterium]|nr:MAG: cyclohexa-1,5-dienecarbonyl-CoA hydratase [Gammaproteobacteria bacterium]
MDSGSDRESVAGEKVDVSAAPLKVHSEHAGRILRLALSRPKANIVDATMLTALGEALESHRDRPELTAVLLCGEGPNFSFGASVEEHLPGQCERMLRLIDGTVLTLLEYPVPVLVAVRGYCLGGGLELACGGNLIFASPGAVFAQPEIQLAVFAPAGSCLLPELIGQARAEDLLFSGRNIKADEALVIGLIHRIADDPEAAALEYIETHLLPRSAFALRLAVTAARSVFAARMRERFMQVEDLYLHRLMAGQDPVEGLRAFIEKRTPHWQHR